MLDCVHNREKQHKLDLAQLICEKLLYGGMYSRAYKIGMLKLPVA